MQAMHILDSRTVHYENPDIITYDNVLNEEECQHFIKISKDSLQRALVSDETKGVVSTGRTGSNTWIPHDHDKITMAVGKRICKLVGLPLENAESFQIIHYNISQEYRCHYDSWPHDYSEKTLRCMKYGGARLKTALCYLNTVAKGGGTKMTKLDITISAEQGKLLIFNNTYSNTDHTRHPLSEHAGLPVEEGEKFAFNLWFKECERNKLYSEHNPDYYKKINELGNVQETNDEDNIHTTQYLNAKKSIALYTGYYQKSDCENLINICKEKFKKNVRRPDAWINHKHFVPFIQKIVNNCNIPSKFCENINVVMYEKDDLHNRHYTAYDLNSETGKKYTQRLGQR